MSLGLTYNVSIGKIPGSARFFANGENQMMNYGTIYARARDAAGNPVPDVRLVASGRETASYTDSRGDALITNMEPYQKVTLMVDETDVEDISLVPDWDLKKLVLRPGVIRPVDVVFHRLGGVEGQLVNMAPNQRYRVFVRRTDGGVARVKNVDADGAFIFDGLKYGDYVIEITDGAGRSVHRRGIYVDQAFQTIDVPFDVKN